MLRKEVECCNNKDMPFLTICIMKRGIYDGKYVQ